MTICSFGTVIVPYILGIKKKVMDKLSLTIAKWQGKKDLIQHQRQETALAGGVAGQQKGAVKKELSAMDAYITTFDMFITDLHGLRND